MLTLSKWKLAFMLSVTLFALLLVVPSFLSKEQLNALRASLPSFLPVKALTLGLDLQGGAHVLMEVDSASVVKSQQDGLRDDVRRVLRENKFAIVGGIGQTPKGVQLRFADGVDTSKALTALGALSQPLGNAFTGNGQRSLEIAQGSDGLISLSLTDAAINDRVRRAVVLWAAWPRGP